MSIVPALRHGCDHADRPAVEGAVAGDDIRRVVRSQLEEAAAVEHILDHDAHVVRGVRAGRNGRGRRDAAPIAGIFGGAPGRIREVMVGQIPEDREQRGAGGKIVANDERRDTGVPGVQCGASQLGARHAHARELCD